MQTKIGSLIEALANVLVGYTIATFAQLWIFHQIGQPISLETSAIVGAFMTLVSIVRSYILRRSFNWITSRASRNQNTSSN